ACPRRTAVSRDVRAARRIAGARAGATARVVSGGAARGRRRRRGAGQVHAQLQIRGADETGVAVAVGPAGAILRARRADTALGGERLAAGASRPHLASERGRDPRASSFSFWKRKPPRS